MRIFLSVEIPERVKKELVGVQDFLKRKLENQNIRWEEQEKMHLTVLFIGELGEEMVTELENVIITEAEKTEPFELGFAGINTFPNNHHPRVIMADIEDGSGDYAELQKRIAKKLRSNDFPCSSPKPPHITIARVRKGSVKLPQVTLKGDRSFTVESIAVKESTLRPTGAVHQTLFACALSLE